MMQPELREYLRTLYDMIGGSDEWSGTTWYVDANRGDDTWVGNIPSAPFQTLTHALGVVASGDRIVVAAGTYNGAHTLGWSGVTIIFQSGARITNTTPGTAFICSGARSTIMGGEFSQAGQIGIHVNNLARLIGCKATGVATGFSLTSGQAILEDCLVESFTATGFELTSSRNNLIRCIAKGEGAVRGFWLSGAADYNLLSRCSTTRCTAGAYDIAVTCDNNVIDHCSQSELCGGPADAGANNTWIWNEESQIAVGNSIQQDIADVHTPASALALRYRGCMDFWSVPQEEVALTNVAGDKSLPDVVVDSLPAGCTVEKAIAMFMFRMEEDDSGGANKLDGAQEIQVRDDSPSAWTDAINFVDDQFGIAADTREGGICVIGAIDVSGTVDGNDTYNFQWDEAVADADALRFNDVQVGLRIWFSV